MPLGCTGAAPRYGVTTGSIGISESPEIERKDCTSPCIAMHWWHEHTCDICSNVWRLRTAGQTSRRGDVSRARRASHRRNMNRHAPREGRSMWHGAKADRSHAMSGERGECKSCGVVFRHPSKVIYSTRSYTIPSHTILSYHLSQIPRDDVGPLAANEVRPLDVLLFAQVQGDKLRYATVL
jgi:hypothetical protein